MVEIYCRKKHQAKNALCPHCLEFFQYGINRLKKCPLWKSKPTCAKCPIHCYQSEMKEKAKEVMRYSGPRMVLFHPFLALLHLFEILKRR